MPVRFIHRGAWSDTVEARSVGGDVSAVKVAEAGGDLADAIARWAEAARSVAESVHHPNVATHRSAHVAEGWLSAERVYVEGVDVGTAIASTGPSRVEIAAGVTRAVARGVGAVHAAGFVAGRLTPSHVLVGRDGGVHLLHAGLPEITGHADRERAGTGDREVPFAPPERFAGGALHPHGDIFGIASTFLLMCTGKPVIPSAHRLARVLSRRGAIVISDGEPPPGLEGALADVMTRALAAEPEARPDLDTLSALLATVAASPEEIAGWTRAVVGDAALGGGRE